MKRIALILVGLIFSSVIFSNCSALTLQEEPLLHPGDIPTGYLLPKGSWILNYPPPSSPGWLWWGFEDFGLVEMDTEAWLGGVPSVNIRFAIMANKNVSIAYENMYQYIPKTFDMLDGVDLDIYRERSNWYHHINSSLKVLDNLYVHLMLGGTYSSYLRLKGSNTEKTYTDTITPDAAIGLDWRPLSWLAFSTGISYGSTFLYVDNVARKQQFSFSVLLAPFCNTDWPVLKAIRLNATYISLKFHDIDAALSGPVMHLYWIINMPKTDE